MHLCVHVCAHVCACVCMCVCCVYMRVCTVCACACMCVCACMSCTSAQSSGALSPRGYKLPGTGKHHTSLCGFNNRHSHEDERGRAQSQGGEAPQTGTSQKLLWGHQGGHRDMAAAGKTPPPRPAGPNHRGCQRHFSLENRPAEAKHSINQYFRHEVDPWSWCCVPPHPYTEPLKESVLGGGAWGR